MNIIFSLPEVLVIDVLTSWLQLKDLTRLDSANLSCISRPEFLSQICGRIIHHKCVVPVLDLTRSIRCIRWLVTRNILITHLTVPIELIAEHELWNLFLVRVVPRLKYVKIEANVATSRPSFLCMFLTLFVHHSRDLLELTLQGDYQIPCLVLQELSRNCPKLTLLEMKGYVEFFGWEMVGTSERFLSLVNFSVGKSNLFDRDLSRLLDFCPHLEALEIGDSRGIRQNGLIDVLNSHAPLKIVKIHGNRHHNSGMIHAVPTLRAQPLLTDVSLDCAFTNAFLTALSQCCPSLTRLTVKNSDALSNAGILAVSTHCTQLTELHIANCHQVTKDICNYFSPTVQVDFKPINIWNAFPGLVNDDEYAFLEDAFNFDVNMIDLPEVTLDHADFF